MELDSNLKSSPDILRELFMYTDGTLLHARNQIGGGKAKIGAPAGYLCGNGYWYVSVRGKHTKRSRVVWEIHNGPIPQDRVVDHIDRDRVNDKIENLRLATTTENLFNSKKRRSSSIYKGVHKNLKHNSWHARLQYQGKEHYLGNFKYEQDAAQAYNYAVRKIAGDFATPNTSGIYEEWI
jgi:hypothetical protein